MTNSNRKPAKSETPQCELTLEQLDVAAGGCPGWLGPVAAAIAFRAWIRSLF